MDHQEILWVPQYMNKDLKVVVVRLNLLNILIYAVAKVLSLKNNFI